MSDILHTSIDDARSSLECDLHNGGTNYTIPQLRKAIDKERNGQQRTSMINLLQTHIRKREKLKEAAVEPEVLPPDETALTAQSEDARLLANYAIQGHDLCRRGGEMLVTGALVCGFIMVKAKERLLHGEFERWEKKHIRKDIPRSTAKLYKQYAEALAQKYESKCLTLGHLIEGVAPADLTESDMRRITGVVAQVTDGRTLADLGRELGILKERQTKSVKARKRIGPLTGDPVKDNEHLARLWADRVTQAAGSANLYLEFLSDEDLSKVVSALVHALSDLGFAKLVGGADA